LPNLRTIGILPVYNEADVIEQVLRYHIEQGLQLIVVDNGSTDGSYEVIKNYVGRGVISVQRIITDRVRFQFLLTTLSAIAAIHAPDWLVLIGADEFLETRNSAKGETLIEGLIEEEKKGYEVVQFDTFEFWPTRLDNPTENDVRRRMKYYTWTSAWNFRAYRWSEMSRFHEHYPTPAPGRILKISPNIFVLRHYRFRSFDHGMRKTFQERLPRFASKSEKWVHYDNCLPNEDFFVRDPNELNRYVEDGRWIRSRKFDPMFGTYDWEKNQPDNYTPPGMRR